MRLLHRLVLVPVPDLYQNLSKIQRSDNGAFAVFPHDFRRPGGSLTEIFNSVCTKPAVAKTKNHKDSGN